MPATVELDPNDVLDTRDRLTSYINEAFPDVATQPGTTIGDLIVTPQSYVLSAIETGMDRVLSDLSLENVANGVVYNCEFVTRYIKNFGVDTAQYYPSSGVVRLTFNEDKDYIFDRSTQFRVNNQIFTIYLPNNGPFYCFSSEKQLTDGINGTTLKQISDEQWFCDIPVVGNNGEVNISNSTDAEISVNLPNLTSLVTLTNFTDGVQTNTLEDLAKKAQTTAFSASLNTRNGAVQYVKSICPFIESVFAVKSGDRELLRDYRNGYGISSGCLDVYARSKSYEFTENQVIKLYLNAQSTYFEGYWHYVGQPYHVESVTHEGFDSTQLEHKILSSNDFNLGASAAYTQREKLYIKVTNLLAPNGQDSLFTTYKDEDGNTYAYFNITYQTDPLLPAISQTVENEEYQPVNASILVRGFIPVIIQEFKVVYVKKEGIIPDLDTATNAIKLYLAQVGAPNSYTDAEIARIMGEAGVKYMKRIDVQARVQWTVADKVLSYGKSVSESNPGDESVFEDVPTVGLNDQYIIRNSDGLRVVYPNPDVPITAETMYSCSPRNIRYFLLENAIKFQEVIDV